MDKYTKEEQCSYLFGTFCATLQKIEEIAFPDAAKKGDHWQQEIVILFRVNPVSTLQFIEELMKKFPSELHKNNKIYLINDLVVLYQQLDLQLLLQEPLNEVLFRKGYEAKIFDYVDESVQDNAVVEEHEHTPPYETMSLSALLGSFIGKLQYMDEFYDEGVMKKGFTYVDDLSILFPLNPESCLQIADTIIKKLPASVNVNGKIVELNEIKYMRQFLTAERFQEESLEKEETTKYYKQQLKYFGLKEE